MLQNALQTAQYSKLAWLLTKHGRDEFGLMRTATLKGSSNHTEHTISNLTKPNLCWLSWQRIL